MITIEDITYDPRIPTSVPGMPLVFVIDGQCVYDFPSNRYGSELFFNNNEIVDISDADSNNDEITVKIIIDENRFNCKLCLSRKNDSGLSNTFCKRG
jgi:hypothetical protein